MVGRPLLLGGQVPGADEAGLADLLAAGERAAFHGRPAAGIEPLRRAVLLAAEHDLQDEAAGASWLLGVCLVSAGRYGGALEVLEPLSGTDGDEPAATEVFAALAGATLASLHRQLGRHADAQGHDERALERATRAGGADEARFDALLGLASDHIGRGAADPARGRLGEAADLTEGRADWWRQRVRLDWVRAELALLGEDPVAAAEAAHRAVDLAERSGAPRHVAKGLLFQGVAQVEAGRRPEAAATLRRGAVLAESLGARPLQWPSRAVLGALLADEGPDESARCLTAARRAVAAIADDLPGPLRADWLARADVAALLDA